MIPVVEIGHRAARVLSGSPTGSVIASFRTAVHLLCDDGSILIVVSPETGWGPLNMVVPASTLAGIQRGNRFEVRSDRFMVGETTIMLMGAPVRVCRPDWRALTTAARTIARDVSNEVRRELRRAWLKTDHLGLEQALSARGAAVVQACGQESDSALEDAVREMCGFGPGLTPAGDDWLVGWLLGLRLLDVRHAERCAESVMSVADVRTTRLSHAYLECAAAGEADSVWQSFLEAMTRTERDGSTSMAIRNTLARGASSGIAAVTGFFAALDSATAQEMMTCRP